MIWPIKPDDVPALKAVIDANELFPAALLDQMTAGYSSGDAGDDVCLNVYDGGPVSIVYY